MKFNNILKNNYFHSIIFISILYFEKKYKINFIFKVLRKFIIQGIYCSEVHPDSFKDLDAIVTLRLPHPYMIIIHRSAQIGKNCTIYQGCTIGVIETYNQLQAANMGNNVYIGVNSVILGNITIGNNVKIGACSLILKDIEDTTTKTGLWK